MNLDEGMVSAHTIAELYAVLTTLPFRPILQPSIVRQLIVHNIYSQMTVIVLSENDYMAIVDHLVGHSLIGGITYDALVMWAAKKSEADQIVTLNPKDFQRVMPEMADKIVIP